MLAGVGLATWKQVEQTASRSSSPRFVLSLARFREVRHTHVGSRTQGHKALVSFLPFLRQQWLIDRNLIEKQSLKKALFTTALASFSEISELNKNNSIKNIGIQNVAFF